MDKCGKIVVSKEALLTNIGEVRRILGNKKICLMVKANAYGHGVERIYNLIHNNVDFFGVSNVNEAEQLYSLNKNLKILIVGKTKNFKSCAEHGFSFIVEGREHFEKLLEFLKKSPSSASCIKIHLKVNCGMNRLGITSPKEFREIYQKALDLEIFIEGIAAHFSTADSDNKIFDLQNKKLEEFIAQIPKRQKPIISVGGSGIVFQKLLGKQINFNMARLGLVLYGYGPRQLNLKPALSVVSHLIKVYDVSKGEYVGYGRGFLAEGDMKVGIVPLGYGDGISRGLSNKFSVWIGGKRARSIGYICMDMFFVDLTGIDAKEGDEVVVFKDAKKWAQVLGTIEYEVLTNLALIR